MKFSKLTVGQLCLSCIVIILLISSAILLSLMSSGTSSNALRSATGNDVTAEVRSSGGPTKAPWSVLVMGMHHSGTSLIARILMECGLWGGERHEFLLQKDAVVQDPPKFWERKDVIALTQGLIRQQRLNTSVPWVTGFGFRPSKVNRPARHKFVTEFRRIVGALAEHGPHMIKEPRLSITGALWRPAVDPERTACIIVFRHPVHVAAGMRQRPRNRAFTMEQWVSLWEKYHLGAMQSCEQLPTVYVSHDWFSLRPRETIALLVTALRNVTGLSSEQLHPPDPRWLSQFLPDHQHRAVEPTDYDSLTTMQALLYRTMESVAQNPSAPHAAGARDALLPYTEQKQRKVHQPGNLPVPGLHVDVHTAEEREAERLEAVGASVDRGIVDQQDAMAGDPADSVHSGGGGGGGAAAVTSSLTLKIVLRAQATYDGQDVVVIPSNTVFSGMARNLVCSLRRAGVHQFVALGLDDFFCDAMSGMGVGCYFDRSFGRGVATLERWTMSSESDYFHILWQKMTYVQEVLDFGYNVLLMDADLVWLNNAHKYIRELPDFDQLDLVIQSDARPWDPSKQDWLCAGFFYMKSNLRTRLFVAQVLALMHQFGAPDQDVFQLLLRGAGQNYAFPLDWQTKPDAERHDEMTRRWLTAKEIGLRWRTLDETLFPNGGRFARQLSQLDKENKLPLDSPSAWADKQIVHVNMRSFEKKKTALERAGLWFVDPFHPDKCLKKK